MQDITLRSSWMMMSFLLLYPDEQWQERADDMFVNWCELLQDENDDQAVKLQEYASDCITEFVGMDSEVITGNYVKTFDFNKKANLYLTYGQLGEERERGPALLKLKQIYEEEGMILASEELPDYLPLVLEYVAVAEENNGVALLLSFRKALEGVRDALTAAGSPYRLVLMGILMLLDQSSVKEGSFHFEASVGYSGTGGGTGTTGCGPMWAAAGYGGGSPFAHQGVNQVERGQSE
ncbi:nitrate reductase delta subunit [Paenibacillus anaericanus]|uniref:nitrate reductase molybdenum cofactor assembly chaperone n=1 Tax=Paenibacillus anaericanus TaxID=170367 RepID=UPI002787AAB6|nr:nitrate reductase molybdenum cofactor assembly chaperone [Paenibacillus anaericanus]MDQ0091452.1 nitrate reductase delta subunit [Paenibacillus anaericanus]